MAIEAVGLIDPVSQWTDANGVPLAGGSVGYYIPSTLTLLNVYSDNALTTPLTNPVPLNASGRTSTSQTGVATAVYLQQTPYDYIVKDVNGVTQIGPITANGSAWPGQVQGAAVLTPAANANGYANRFTTTINKASSGTHSLFAGVRIDIPTIGAGASTLSEADTVYIEGAPATGTTTYALNVASGNVNMGGNLTLGGTLGVGSLNLVNLNSAVTSALNSNANGHLITETITTQATGTHPLIVGTNMSAPTMVSSGAAVTEADTLYIAAAPSIAGTNNALRVASGNTTLTGPVITGSTIVGGSTVTAPTGYFEFGRTSRLGAWINLPSSSAGSLISTNSTGSITPASSHPWVYRYCFIGGTMIAQCGVQVAVNNGTTTEIRFGFPGFAPLAYDPVSGSDDNQAAGTGSWISGGTAGLVGVFINVGGPYLSAQRLDGVPAAGYPVATIFVRFTMEVPLFT